MGSVARRRFAQARPCTSLTARHLDEGPCWVLELSGEADVVTLGVLRAELAHAVAMNHERVVVELSRLRFCDVQSAHSILAASRATPITVRGATGSVRRTFDLLGSLQQRSGYGAVPPSPALQTA